MSIEFACGCGKKLKIADEHAGKKIKCPACKAVLTVPVPEEEPVECDVMEEEEPVECDVEEEVITAVAEAPKKKPPKDEVTEKPAKEKKKKSKKSPVKRSGGLADMYTRQAEAQLARDAQRGRGGRGDSNEGWTMFGV